LHGQTCFDIRGGDSIRIVAGLSVAILHATVAGATLVL